MYNAVPTAIILVLSCLFTLSTGLPSMHDQLVPSQTGLNVPCTLLGKPYRKRSNSQGCTPWTLAVADHNNSIANVVSLVNPSTDPEYRPADKAPSGGAWTAAETDMRSRIWIPLQLVIATSPESMPARLRLIRSKRSVQNPNSDDVPLSPRALSDGMTLADDDAQRARPRARMSEPRTSVRVGRSKRLYDRGGWKSRFEY